MHTELSCQLLVLTVVSPYRESGLPAPVPGQAADGAGVRHHCRCDEQRMEPLLVDNDLVPLVLGDQLAVFKPGNLWCRATVDPAAKSYLSVTTSIVVVLGTAMYIPGHPQCRLGRWRRRK